MRVSQKTDLQNKPRISMVKFKFSQKDTSEDTEGRLKVQLAKGERGFIVPTYFAKI